MIDVKQRALNIIGPTAKPNHPRDSDSNKRNESPAMTQPRRRFARIVDHEWPDAKQYAGRHQENNLRHHQRGRTANLFESFRHVSTSSNYFASDKRAGASPPPSSQAKLASAGRTAATCASPSGSG